VQDKVQEFESDLGTPIKLGYLDVGKTADLKWLSGRLDAGQYPLVLIKKEDFAQKIISIRKLQLESMGYLNLAEELAQRDSLNTLKDEVYQEIIAAERQRADRFKETNTQLNEQITRIDEQIERAADLTQKSMRGRNLRNLSMGLLGGGVGLSVGLLVGVIMGNSGR
jgi:hypothetical protein